MRRAAGILALALVLVLPGSAWAGDTGTTDEVLVVEPEPTPTPTPEPTPEPVVTRVTLPASVTYRRVSGNAYEAAWRVEVASNSPTGIVVTADFDPIPGASRSLSESCAGWGTGSTLLVTDGPVDASCTYTLRVVAGEAGTFHRTITVTAEERP